MATTKAKDRREEARQVTDDLRQAPRRTKKERRKAARERLLARHGGNRQSPLAILATRPAAEVQPSRLGWLPGAVARPAESPPPPRHYSREPHGHGMPAHFVPVK